VRKLSKKFTNIVLGGVATVAATQPAMAQPQPLVPNPNVTITDNTGNIPVGTTLPAATTRTRAVAPPVGDISVSSLDATSPAIRLDSNARVSIVLKEAPAREVLEMLSRNAGLNLAYAGGSNFDASGKKLPEPTISLNLKNEPVENAFNYVLQISGYEANRVGNTVFVGPKLPDSIRGTVVRTLRMNQVSAEAASAFLTTQGAETQIARDRVQIQSFGEGAAARTVETRTPEILNLRATEGNSPLLLKGLSISSDSRMNSITVVGSQQKVELATAMLTRLDARRRQVALNVKIIDVNLNNSDELKNSLSFGTGNGLLAVDGGAAVFNYGGNNPLGTSNALNPTITSNGGNVIGVPPTTTTVTLDPTVVTRTTTIPGFNIPSKFLSTLQAQIVSGNGKILTDPTMVVQEGQTSKVKLTQEVFGGFESLVSTTGASTSSTVARKPIIRNAGLTLDVSVNRIDDNGFISVGVSPTVSALSGSVVTPDGNIALLQERTLTSGEIRLRDGQTLIMSGIIQESDRTTVSKVPILGDIPILGALFRSTSKTNSRQEVIVLLTPRILNDGTNQVNYTPGNDARQMMQRP
jgi:type IV pilus assembly protein PilQ